jgi:peptidoglycan hydrolase-like protein with peptidoglycan-binding domain
MMRIAAVLSAVALSASIFGCATSTKNTELENQALRNQITVLEKQLQSKDKEILVLRKELAGRPARAESLTTEKAVTPAQAQPTVKDVQVALKNAGYDPGKIDGIMGPKTREAIMAFQKTHSLKLTGKADEATWALLKDYLNKKEK